MLLDRLLQRKTGHIGSQVQAAIENDTAILCGVVIAELLQGAKGKKEKQQLTLLFDSIPSLRVEEHDWHDAGATLRQLREKGFTIPLSDALIATIARRNGVPVMMKGKHFQHLPAKLIDV